MLFHMGTLYTVLIDIAVWFAIHMGVSYLMTRRPRYSFNPESWLYRERGWEGKGSLYYRWLKVGIWKHVLPDGAALFESGFKKKYLQEYTLAYFQDFRQETCRAELTHWIVFSISLIFFIWNIWWVGIIMIIYAFSANMPCIITQRYNRIRLNRVIIKMQGLHNVIINS
jgi:glycosyl-4,4'-diaponeurosporenoate acyltransferase